MKPGLDVDAVHLNIAHIKYALKRPEMGHVYFMESIFLFSDVSVRFKNIGWSGSLLFICNLSTSVCLFF